MACRHGNEFVSGHRERANCSACAKAEHLLCLCKPNAFAAHGVGYLRVHLRHQHEKDDGHTRAAQPVRNTIRAELRVRTK